MKFEPAKLSKVIEQNYSYLVPNFYEMQTDYLNSMNILYKDLDASLIVMLLTKKIYQVATNKDNGATNNISVNSFYEEKSHGLPVSNFKIKEISKTLNLPRETVRRKKVKLIKNKFIIFNKKKKTYSLNRKKIDENIIRTQIEISNKFLYNYCVFFSRKNNFLDGIDLDSFKNQISKKFLLFLPIFLNFQISYLSAMRKIFDMESLFINLLCALNTTTHIKKKNLDSNKIFNSQDIFTQLPKITEKFGLNSSSIAEITKIPRTTVLRKLAKLEKLSILKKDEFKRYAHNDLYNSTIGKRLYYPVMQNTLQLLGVFISECLEIYSSKELETN